MKIAIMGAGMTGAYLAKLLDDKGHAVRVFDKDPGTRCGIKPCAWGTSRGFAELVGAAGLEPLDYLLQKTDHVLMDGLRITADLMTFDKRRLIADLLAGVQVDRGAPQLHRYERIIDATGVARAFLPPLQDDIILPCVQYRVVTDRALGNCIQLGKIGYGWSFPLSRGEYHLGCGSLLTDPGRTLAETGWLGGDQKITCSCRGEVRLSSPQYSQPFVAVHGAAMVWGVGEAIGCVAPLAGDGVVPGMRSARLMMEWWHDPSGYSRAILKEFKWMEPERRVLDRLRKNMQLTVRDAWVLKKNAVRMGMQIGLKEAASLLAHLR